MGEEEDYEEAEPVGRDWSKVVLSAVVIVPLGVFILAILGVVASVYLGIVGE